MVQRIYYWRTTYKALNFIETEAIKNYTGDFETDYKFVQSLCKSKLKSILFNPEDILAVQIGIMEDIGYNELSNYAHNPKLAVFVKDLKDKVSKYVTLDSLSLFDIFVYAKQLYQIVETCDSHYSVENKATGIVYKWSLTEYIKYPVEFIRKEIPITEITEKRTEDVQLPFSNIKLSQLKEALLR